MKHYFLGMAANYNREDRYAQLFSMGRREDLDDLVHFLERKYGGTKALLTKNGRSALALALKAYFEPGDRVIVNGFTCYAVFEAIKAAKLNPIFVDISKADLNFDFDALELLWKGDKKDIKGIIVQNTLGNPINIQAIEKLANNHNLTIIEDLAHSAGIKYADGREAGTVGAATILSFGKDKSIDTISGGAVILRSPCKNEVAAPSKTPKLSDHLRARFYPTFGAMARALTRIHLGGALMRLLVKIHWVERSADNRLDLTRRPSKFIAKRALIQIKCLTKTGEPPLRDFYFVKNRTDVLKKLQKAGFYFGGFWYEKPVSPARYYQKIHFPESSCPNSVYVAEHIVNVPTYYSRQALKPALKIIKDNLMEDQNE